jgi:hypothetical protein
MRDDDFRFKFFRFKFQTAKNRFARHCKPTDWREAPARHGFAISRRLTPEVCHKIPYPPIRGRGECRAPDAPAAACAMSVVERTRVSQVTPESPSIPRAMVLRLISCSPRRPGFLATVACGYRFRKLDASVGASGPHVFAVRLNTVRYRRIRVHRIPPRVRDDREPPLCEAGRRGI